MSRTEGQFVLVFVILFVEVAHTHGGEQSHKAEARAKYAPKGYDVAKGERDGHKGQSDDE